MTTHQLLVLANYQNRLALGIVRAYCLLHPQAKLADLQAAFPKTLHANPGVPQIIADVTQVPDLQSPDWHGYFTKPGELISLADGTRIAITTMWPGDDLDRLVDIASRQGIAALLSDPLPAQPYPLPGSSTTPASAGPGYAIFYLNGFKPGHGKSALLLEVEDDVRRFLRHLASLPSRGKRHLFFNERALQVELAVWLKQQRDADAQPKYDTVNLEYAVPVTLLHQYEAWMPKDTLYIDIVVGRAGEYVPVELKYVTTEACFARECLGISLSKEESGLKSQTAYNNRMYDYWLDVRRIELLKANSPAVNGGLVIFLTNDDTYTKKPAAKLMRAPFAMDKGEHDTNRHWPEGTCENTRDSRPGFDLDHPHTISWDRVKIDNIRFYFNLLLI